MYPRKKNFANKASLCCVVVWMCCFSIINLLHIIEIFAPLETLHVCDSCVLPRQTCCISSSSISIAIYPVVTYRYVESSLWLSTMSPFCQTWLSSWSTSLEISRETQTEYVTDVMRVYETKYLKAWKSLVLRALWAFTFESLLPYSSLWALPAEGMAWSGPWSQQKCTK